MDKKLTWRFILIAAVVLLSILAVYPPQKTLKAGIDLAGGTSLIYEIDAHGMSSAEKSNLSSDMITVLKRRIDPGSMQNLIWRPQGSTRFEIQMPLTSAEARKKRQDYETALQDILSTNVSPASILLSLKKPIDQRTADYEKLSSRIPASKIIIDNLSQIYDQREQIRKTNQQLRGELKKVEDTFAALGLNSDEIKSNIISWTKLDQQDLEKAMLSFAKSDSNAKVLTQYLAKYKEWMKVSDELTVPEKGLNDKFRIAQRDLDKLNLSEEQLAYILDKGGKYERSKLLDKIKSDFPEKKDQIDKIAKAYEDYKPFKGQLDDPSDLQRMLKGAGILEFRILPTLNDTSLSAEQAETYRKALKEKGPKYASDKNYVWILIETIEEWKNTNVIADKFGDKDYVLGSNKSNECMLHTSREKDWRLKKSWPTSDQQGRRAISFELDQKGGFIFYKITGDNIGKPLCIILDEMAISAPNIQDRIGSSGIITGSFTDVQQRDMVNKLNAGSLPARLIEQPISVKTIGPSLGANNRDQGILSGIVGLIGVMLCMIVYYTLSGGIANIALLLNILITLAFMSLLKATFTLPGIAGLILTIGMSVDANVLIFERIREEQQKGCSLRVAIKNGYDRAFITIFDSNLTTVISAMVLYWVASEEIKGFAIVLILGLASSMFTALFVTHAVFDYLVNKKILKDHLVMMNLIKVPNIDWMKLRPVFFTISAVLTIGGLAVFFTRDNVKNNKYDIEFTGGTSVTINLKENVKLNRQQVEDKIHEVGNQVKNPAVASAKVYAIGKAEKQYEITTTETNKTYVNVTFKQPGQTVESVLLAVKDAEKKSDGILNKLNVAADAQANTFTITTSNLNKSFIKDVLTAAFEKTPDAVITEPVVDEVVNNAVITAFENDLEVKRNLKLSIVQAEKITEKMIEASPELANFIGGVKILCSIEKPATSDDIDQRIKDLRFKPDTRDLIWYNYRIFTMELTGPPADQQLSKFVYVSADPEAAYRELSEDEWNQFVDSETTKVRTAGAIETSLPRVTQVDPSIGDEAKTRALIAIVLSLIALLIYIWVRFGNLRYGLGAVITLFHDTCVSLGAVTACTYIAATAIGQTLLIGDFKIDLTMIAAFLTLIGYSLNDSIVVYDRIRENRRKGTLTPQLISTSINQTLSRTLLTGTTTLLVVFIMYVFGGKGLRGFNFTMLFGILIGTYSSIAISAPILLIGGKKALQQQVQVQPQESK